MVAQGGLLSELSLGTPPDAHHFPARNRIIAGMSDVTLVIEAAKKGGALITAEIANSYNRDVFALPGDVGHHFSEGCNNLIKTNKAHLLTCIEDIEYIMNWEHQGTRHHWMINTTTMRHYQQMKRTLLRPYAMNRMVY